MNTAAAWSSGPSARERSFTCCPRAPRRRFPSCCATASRRTPNNAGAAHASTEPMRALYWLAATAVLFGLWLLFAGAQTHELIVGAGASALAATAVEAVRGTQHP